MPVTSTSFAHGKTGSVLVNGASQPLTDWSVDFKADAVEVTNFLSEGVTENVFGIASAEITASGPYDGSSGASPGNDCTFTLGVGGAGFVVKARITSVKVDLNVKDVAKISYSATSNGVFGASP
ncbi:hypothetical protein [Sphingorhabdus sp.]|uniref:hypothetical protein n=1 Tax=Sphingorhabdus sp. TaxID=1902408 RepID=UPI002FDB0727